MRTSSELNLSITTLLLTVFFKVSCKQFKQVQGVVLVLDTELPSKHGTLGIVLGWFTLKTGMPGQDLTWSRFLDSYGTEWMAVREVQMSSYYGTVPCLVIR